MNVLSRTARWLERQNALTYIPQALQYLADEEGSRQVESDAFTIFIGDKKIVLPNDPILKKWPTLYRRSLNQAEIEITRLTIRQLQCLVAMADGSILKPKDIIQNQSEQMGEAIRLVKDWLVGSHKEQALNRLLECALADKDFRAVGKLLSLGASSRPVVLIVKETIRTPNSVAAFNLWVSVFEQAGQYPDLQEAFDNPNVSDHVVVCGGDCIHVNLRMLSLSSGFFQGVGNSGMQESTTNRTEIIDLSPIAVREVLLAMYKGQFRVPKIVEGKSDLDNATTLLLGGILEFGDYIACLDFFIVKPYAETLAFLKRAPTFAVLELIEDEIAPNLIGAHMRSRVIPISSLVPIIMYALETPETAALYSICLKIIAAFDSGFFIWQDFFTEHNVLKGAFNNPNVSDCVFRFPGEKLHVNRTLLTLQSTYFADLFERTSEAEITFDGSGQERLLLQYLYGNPVAITDATYDSVLTMAKTHGAPLLREACRRWFLSQKAPLLKSDYRAFYAEAEKLDCKRSQEDICNVLFHGHVACDGGAQLATWHKSRYQSASWMQAFTRMSIRDVNKADIFSFLCEQSQFVTEMLFSERTACDFALFYACFPQVKRLHVVQAKATCVQQITAISGLSSLHLIRSDLQDYLRFGLLSSLTDLTLEECNYFISPTATWGLTVPFELLRTCATLPLLSSLTITSADTLFTSLVPGFRRLEKLQYLRTDAESKISTQEIAHIASLSTLREVTLDAWDYEDLTPLLACKTLATLDIYRHRMSVTSGATFREFKAAFKGRIHVLERIVSHA